MVKYQYITQFDSPNCTPQASVAAVFGRARAIAGFTHHWWGDPAQNPKFEGVVSWLCRSGGNTSAHYVVEAGRVACIVSPYDAAWHTGNAIGNATTIGIECNPRASDADYETIAQFNAQLIDAFGDQIKYKHNDWFATACPGVYDINRIDRESYNWISSADWGDVTPKNQPAPTPTPAPIPPAPTPTPVTTAEWVTNLKDITDTKLQVLKADGARRVNLITGEVFGEVIPRGTNVDIAKETTFRGVKYYISSSSAKANAAIGLEASAFGVPATPPTNDKPEWQKNLKDIADQDFWTRSETHVLNLADGQSVNVLPVNTKVRVTHVTQIVGNDIMVLDGGKTGIDKLYLSDKPIENPTENIDKRLTALETLVKMIVDFLTSFTKFKK